MEGHQLMEREVGIRIGLQTVGDVKVTDLDVSTPPAPAGQIEVEVMKLELTIIAILHVEPMFPIGPSRLASWAVPMQDFLEQGCGCPS